MLQNRLLAGAIVMLTLLTACNSKKGESNIPNTTNEATADTIATEQVADSTIYGTSGEDFGMSTFCLITDKGDTLQVCRTANDGTDANIYGSIEYGDRYAMTTRDNGESLGVLINLTELDKKLKNYEIVNGKLIVKGDTVALDKYFK